MTIQLIRADARNLPLADESVDLIVTSPPYWALRSYTDGGEHYAGQIGSELTPAPYIDSLIECTAEWMRVLKPTGSLWVNLGDKYAGSPSGPRSAATPELAARIGGILSGTFQERRRVTHGVPQKSLIGLPWRYAIRCIDDLGLILRAELIWSKPNGLPESVTDRVRRSHEYWFHLVKQPRYFSAIDTIREAHTGGAHGSGNGGSRRWITSNDGQRHRSLDTDPSEYNPLGKPPGSVWEIATQPLTVPAELGVDHFAAFPMEWPRRIIQGWSPSGICTACGEGRRLVADRTEKALHRPSGAARIGTTFDAAAPGRERTNVGNVRTVHRIIGEACACPDTAAPSRPAVVLDSFGGTGTTALVADALGRHGISVDMSADYLRLARWRTTDPGQRAAAMQVEKPAKQADGQLELLGWSG